MGVEGGLYAPPLWRWHGSYPVFSISHCPPPPPTNYIEPFSINLSGNKRSFLVLQL